MIGGFELLGPVVIGLAIEHWWKTRGDDNYSSRQPVYVFSSSEFKQPTEQETRRLSLVSSAPSDSVVDVLTMHGVAALLASRIEHRHFK